MTKDEFENEKWKILRDIHLTEFMKKVALGELKKKFEDENHKNEMMDDGFRVKDHQNFDQYLIYLRNKAVNLGLSRSEANKMPFSDLNTYIYFKTGMDTRMDDSEGNPDFNE